MKESTYNVYFLDKKEQKGLIFNTMHRSVARIDNEVFKMMRNEKIDCIEDDVLKTLEEGGFIVDDNLNELDMLKIMFNKLKFSAVYGGFTVIPTHACNLACKYCYQGHGDVLSSTMNEETVKRTVEFIKKNSMGRRVLSVDFYGGEPLLFTNLVFRILEELKKFTDENNIQFLPMFTSNGTLFTEEIVEKLKDYNHEVQITLCGPREVHDSIRIDRKGNGTYERLMDVIHLFRAHSIAFHIRVDVDRDNYDTIRLLLEDLIERGYSGLYISFCPLGEDICYTETERSINAVDGASLARLAKMAHDMGFKTNPIYIHNFVEGCTAISDSSLTIDPKGDVYKCIAAPNFAEHRFGTLDENGDLIDLNYEAYCAWILRDPLLIEECRDCKFSPLCGGGCALAAYTKHGSINTPGCEEKELGEILRTFIMLNYPELFEECTYESIIL